MRQIPLFFNKHNCIWDKYSHSWDNYSHIWDKFSYIWGDTVIVGKNTVVIWTNTILFGTNTVVFWTNTMVLGLKQSYLVQIQWYSGIYIGIWYIASSQIISIEAMCLEAIWQFTNSCIYKFLKLFIQDSKYEFLINFIMFLSFELLSSSSIQAYLRKIHSNFGQMQLYLGQIQSYFGQIQ